MGSDNKPKTEAEPKKINIFMVLIPCLILLAIGTVLAAAIFNFDGNKDKYEEKIAAAAAEVLYKEYNCCRPSFSNFCVDICNVFHSISFGKN